MPAELESIPAVAGCLSSRSPAVVSFVNATSPDRHRLVHSAASGLPAGKVMQTPA
jgi:hypothetical protein